MTNSYFQIPHLASPTNEYDRTYFDRLIAQISKTFSDIRNRGDVIVGALNASGNITTSGETYGGVLALPITVGDETTTITTGTAKYTFRMPFAMTLSSVKGSLVTASSSGGPFAFDVNKGGVSIFSTTPTIDDTEKTTATAATPSVLSTTALADDDEITIDVDTAGTSAAGLKVYLIGKKA